MFRWRDDSNSNDDLSVGTFVFFSQLRIEIDFMQNWTSQMKTENASQKAKK